MARIVVIQHQTHPRNCEKFSLKLLLDRWQEDGHEPMIVSGVDDLPDADLAILHLNLSIVGKNYVEAARRYPCVVNGAALDIRKKVVSRNIIGLDDEWDGPVIVKTDLNCGGLPELEARRLALKFGGELVDAPPGRAGYLLYRHKNNVPERFWAQDHMVVERFLPECDGNDFYLRTWIFFGDHERCRRIAGDKPMLKGADYRDIEAVEVPDFLRSERERLGFDYGKFDFVIHDGEPILLDANKTPGIPPETRPDLRESYLALAGGLDSFLMPQRC